MLKVHLPGRYSLERDMRCTDEDQIWLRLFEEEEKEDTEAPKLVLASPVGEVTLSHAGLPE